MAIAIKDLPAVNDEIKLVLDNDCSYNITVQYISGAGTIVLEGSLDDGTTWDDIVVTKTDDATETPAATMTAAGLYTASVAGMSRVRVRKSVGSASLNAALGIACL
jgi:hypothetical protein